MSKKEKKPTSNAFPAPVNDQIENHLDEAPAIALGNVYQQAAHSTGIMFENAVNNQNQQNILGQAATTQGIMQIYSLDTAADAVSVEKMLNENEVDHYHVRVQKNKK
ncbi:RebB family R body protein [Chryseobacterium sp. SIMBA_038]|uniref:RebB family R body protein n=1 Tax=Chryseobacterium sp. SIMBA_038 TaxID=3085780 RepID=UPI00397C12A1